MRPIDLTAIRKQNLVKLLDLMTLAPGRTRQELADCRRACPDCWERQIELLSSLLAVCCVTVAFCSNFLLVQDKSSGAYKELSVSPVKTGTLSLAYYLSCAFSTFVVCFVALVAGLLYLYATGWYMTFSHILVLVGDVVLMVLFGTSLSSLVICKLTTQGQAANG